MFTVFWPMARLRRPRHLGARAARRGASASSVGPHRLRAVPRPRRRQRVVCRPLLGVGSCVVNCSDDCDRYRPGACRRAVGRPAPPSSTSPRSSHLPSQHPTTTARRLLRRRCTYKKLLLGSLEHLGDRQTAHASVAPDAPEFLQADARLAEQVRRAAHPHASPPPPFSPRPSPHRAQARCTLWPTRPPKSSAPNDDDATSLRCWRRLQHRLRALARLRHRRSCRCALLGRAVTHGEITLSALLPRASRASACDASSFAVASSCAPVASAARSRAPPRARRSAPQAPRPARPAPPRGAQPPPRLRPPRPLDRREAARSLRSDARPPAGATPAGLCRRRAGRRLVPRCFITGLKQPSPHAHAHDLRTSSENCSSRAC